MTTITIHVTNEHHDGWLHYVLGLPRDDSWSQAKRDGWDMGQETPGLGPMHWVMRRMTSRPVPSPIRIEVSEST